MKDLALILMRNVAPDVALINYGLVLDRSIKSGEHATRQSGIAMGNNGQDEVVGS